MRLRIHPTALVELDEAVTDLEERRKGFGALLLDEVVHRVAQAARWPRSGAPVSGFGERHDVRQYVVKRFRYVVITAIVKKERLVIAIAHTSREPQYWRDRLK
ncbi:MAG: type II toxin-antitoxin system RelE/ParE family toxin [Myxococcales bacterium]|nr:type II toxin-antitoxin system RelE/ParE family toxin [Myxococcales bacterium]